MSSFGLNKQRDGRHLLAFIKTVLNVLIKKVDNITFDDLGAMMRR
ncbi:hypothetical protein JCM19232_1589 [Vibrio ishigakensis]|uniref:Uncharacterized protein n=1 Tax=Vibrio ishigakensis TaxID=1481914 RepID=A0A0B8PN12_9VIBR|nr:hypothetical protein JCM19232_1589 [Vibrio ishigakensis]